MYLGSLKYFSEISQYVKFKNEHYIHTVHTYIIYIEDFAENVAQQFYYQNQHLLMEIHSAQGPKPALSNHETNNKLLESFRSKF